MVVYVDCPIHISRYIAQTALIQGGLAVARLNKGKAVVNKFLPKLLQVKKLLRNIFTKFNNGVMVTIVT